VITIYPDNNNTKRSAPLLACTKYCADRKESDNNLALASSIPAFLASIRTGINALLNITVQPYIDQMTLSEAEKLIDLQAKKGWRKIRLVQIHSARLKQLHSCLSVANTMTGMERISRSLKEGLVEAGIPFKLAKK